MIRTLLGWERGFLPNAGTTTREQIAWKVPSTYSCKLGRHLRAKRKSQNESDVPASATWHAFAARHPGHRFLTEDPIYALTEEVITALGEEVPGFLTAADEAFERDLSRTAGGGFFHGVPIGGLLGRDGGSPVAAPNSRVPAEEAPAGSKAELISGGGAVSVGQFINAHNRLDRRSPRPAPTVAPPLRPDRDPGTVAGDLVRRVRELSGDLRRQAGQPEIEVEWLDRQEVAESVATGDKQEAYAYWLVTRPTYRSEVDALRGEWESQIRAMREFPSVVDSEANKPFAADCRRDFGRFYRRWGLERLLTWDIPLPLDPSVVRPEDRPWPYDQGTGVVVFLPWYLLKGTQFDVSNFVRRLRIGQAPAHLAEWLTQSAGERGRLSGEIALREKFWLYRTHILVLVRRYAAKCARNLERIEIAMAKSLGRREDLVRKLRQSLTRDLRRAGAI